MQSLFPQHNAQTPGDKPLLEFKAGKCHMVSQEDGDFMVTPDEKRGKIAIVKGEGYVYFRWIDRVTNQMDVNCNWIVFQDSVVFKKIDTGRAEDRVYLLKWKDENRRLMFWMQDKNSDKDDANCKQVNELFNNPSAVLAAVAAQRDSEGEGGGGHVGPNEFMRMMGLNSSTGRSTTITSRGLSNNTTDTNRGSSQALDLSRILAGLGGPSSNTPNPPSGSITHSSHSLPNAPPASTSGVGGPVSNSLSLSDLARAFASTSSQSTLTNMARTEAVVNRNITDLNRVLTADAILSSEILDDPSIRESLVSLLPEGQQSEEFLEANIRSPQFQQALDALGHALSSENFNSVMANLGIDPAPGSDLLVRGDFIRAFLAAVNAAATRSQSSSEEEQSDENSSNDTKADGES